MNVEKRGTPKSERLWRGTCFSCHSLMNAEAKELRVEYDLREDSEFARAVCPVCGQSFVLYPTKGKQ